MHVGHISIVNSNNYIQGISMAEYQKTITGIAIHPKDQDYFVSLNDGIKVSFSGNKSSFHVSINNDQEFVIEYEQAIEVVKAMKMLIEQKGVSGE